ncbi:MAG: hypothetical protein KDB33_02795 [Acidimicrobiales bacterium]|nr:hypothetical protein [Acidimicrobiales bacterium]MCB1259315.1 hypothetical protein [Acidimicrobiales bacterium]MCB9394103.1 hypothetical protein [Acidimicrobiaceae bacterium]
MPGTLGRVRERAAGVGSRLRASGAAVVQLVQALGSFLLQAIVARTLGLDGLAVFSALFGVMVLGAGVASGMVGDSLTVLDRTAARIRSSLVSWAAVVAVGGAAVAVVVSASGGRLDLDVDAVTAVWFVIATPLFLLEEVGRRLLMAVMRFWSVVVVDLVALAASVISLAAIGIAGRVTLGSFLAAVAVGQTAALIAVVALLPADERRLGALRRPRSDEVWAYGRWRAVQQFMRLATITALRLVGIAVAGATAYGRVEAARLVVAPAIHVIGGMANFLFAGYARTRDRPLAAQVAATDRQVVRLASLVAGVGVLAVLGEPVWSSIVVGEADELSSLALLAWTAYAAASSASTPYGALAAARGVQRTVTGIRVAESVSSIVAVAVVVGLGASVASGPAMMAVATLAAGWAVRRHVLGLAGEPPN